MECLQLLPSTVNMLHNSLTTRTQKLSILNSRRKSPSLPSPMYSNFSFPKTPLSPSSPFSSCVVKSAVSESQSGVEMQDFYTLRKNVETTMGRVQGIRASSGLQQLEEDLKGLETKAADSSLWDDRVSAQETLSALTEIKDRIKLLNEFKTQVEDAEMIVQLTEEMDSIDIGLLEEAKNIVRDLNKALDRFELTQLLSGPYDKEGAVISITAGAGGTDAQDAQVNRSRCHVFMYKLASLHILSQENCLFSSHMDPHPQKFPKELHTFLNYAVGLFKYGHIEGVGLLNTDFKKQLQSCKYNYKYPNLHIFLTFSNMDLTNSFTLLREKFNPQDWADMLLRMYVRWGEKQRYKTKVVEMSAGEEAGIKSATIELEGSYAYGYVSGEKGTHRIVRQSPFNSKGLRQTSFSGVEVMPLLPEESLNVDIPEEDLDISFSRAGGKGGQNVNKIESAVRIVHIPTGVAVRCTEERSQLANKTKALIRLKAKLLVIAEEQRASEIKQIRGDVVKAEWGQQIRNYVFHPYKLVKDVRTGFETTDITSVMDGELEPFIKAYLKLKYSKTIGNPDGVK